MSLTLPSIALNAILQNGSGARSAPWDAVFLPVAEFPIPQQKMPPFRKFWSACDRAFLKGGKLTPEVFLQTNHLGKIGSGRLVRHAREWMPQVGLGVWPDQKPPALPTAADIQDLGPGEKPRPMMYQVMHISGEAATRRMALAAMLGTGVALEIVTPAGGEDFLKRSRDLLLPPIKEPGFRNYPFYVPIIDPPSLQGATAEQLDRWFCGASAYIRECVEHKGILIVSRNPLMPLLKQLGGEFLQEPEPHWQIPC